MASIIYKGTNGVGGGSGNTIYAFSDGAYTWQTIAADTTAQDNYAYLVDDTDPVVISPPNSPNVGDTFLAMSINGVVAFDFKINGEYNADILKAIRIGSINTPFRFFYTGATYGWACENANEFGDYSTSDPYFNNIVLFIKGDGADGSTNIIDESPTPKTITVNGNAQISTSQSKYGGSSIYFDGSGDYLQIANNVDFDFDGDFTIEFWAYLTGTTLYYPTHFSFRTQDATTGNKISSSYGDSGYGYKMNFGFPSGSSNFTSTITQTTHNGQWVHIALTREGGTSKAFVNGILDYSVANTIPTSGCYLTIGQNKNQFGTFYFTGYIDSFRVTKGVARYTANFDPETDTYLG